MRRTRSPFAVAACGLACGLAWAAPARADGSVDTVAAAAAGSLRGAPGASVVVAAPLVSDEIAPRGEELALRVAALVAGRIGAGAHAHPQASQLAAARAVAGRASALVYVQTEIAKGDLRTTVDVYPPTANAWERIRNPLPSPIGHAFATAKLDAEARTFLVPVVLEQATVDRVRHDEGEVLAAACGDVDGDGGDELVLVSRSRVVLGRVRGGRFVAEHAANFDALAPRLPVPMRDPLAAAVIGPNAVSVGSTDFGGLRLTGALAADTNVSLAGLPAWGGEDLVCLRPEPSAGAFDGAPVDCKVAHEPKPKLAVPAPRFDAFAAVSVADANGATQTVVAVHEPSGRLRLKSGDDGASASASSSGAFGAQLAIGDLDEDGEPDVVTTSDGAVGNGADAIDVASWAGGADLRPRWRITTPDTVRALAICPPEERGLPVLVAVLGTEIWLIRAADAPRLSPATPATPPTSATPAPAAAKATP